MITRNNYIFPNELQPYHRSESDVSILIGENGSGKSQMLARLAATYQWSGKDVIAISNSIYDKFPNHGSRLHLLRDRSGRQKAKRSIKHALLNIQDDELTRYKYISEALTFVGYDPVIGIQRLSITEELDKAINRLGQDGAGNLNNLDDDPMFRVQIFDDA